MFFQSALLHLTFCNGKDPGILFHYQLLSMNLKKNVVQIANTYCKAQAETNASVGIIIQQICKERFI